MSTIEPLSDVEYRTAYSAVYTTLDALQMSDEGHIWRPVNKADLACVTDKAIRAMLSAGFKLPVDHLKSTQEPVTEDELAGVIERHTSWLHGKHLMKDLLASFHVSRKP